MTAVAIGNGWCTAHPAERIDRRAFVSDAGGVGPGRRLTARLAPGQYLWTPELGPWTALGMWDPVASIGSLGVYDSGTSHLHTRAQLHELLESGARLATLRFGAIVSPTNVSLPRVWGVLEHRLRPAALPAPDPSDPAPGPANVWAGERAYLLNNGAGCWLCCRTPRDI